MNSFTDQALEQCRKTLVVYEDAMPLSGKALTLGLKWLEQAQRLRLEVPLIPDGTEERKVASLKEYGFGMDSPWPITAIEYEHGGVYDVRQDYTRALCTRRIALCVNIPDSVAPMSIAADENGQTVDQSMGSLLVWPISYFDEKKEWEFSPGVVLVPRAQGEREMALAENHLLALAHFAESRIRRVFGGAAIDGDAPMVVRYQDMMPELCQKLGEVHAEKMIKESSLDALWVVLGSFTAMGCKNVFMRGDERFLRSYSPQGEASGLDPFRGSRHLSWNGKGKWVQNTKGLVYAKKIA